MPPGRTRSFLRIEFHYRLRCAEAISSNPDSSGTSTAARLQLSLTQHSRRQSLSANETIFFEAIGCNLARLTRQSCSVISIATHHAASDRSQSLFIVLRHSLRANASPRSAHQWSISSSSLQPSAIAAFTRSVTVTSGGCGGLKPPLLLYTF